MRQISHFSAVQCCFFKNKTLFSCCESIWLCLHLINKQIVVYIVFDAETVSMLEQLSLLPKINLCASLILPYISPSSSPLHHDTTQQQWSGNIDYIARSLELTYGNLQCLSHLVFGWTVYAYSKKWQWLCFLPSSLLITTKCVRVYVWDTWHESVVYSTARFHLAGSQCSMASGCRSDNQDTHVS